MGLGALPFVFDTADLRSVAFEILNTPHIGNKRKSARSGFKIGMAPLGVPTLWRRYAKPMTFPSQNGAARDLVRPQCPTLNRHR